MSRTERHKRLRLLIQKVNKHRKQQASKIDILCNDLISAQRAFLGRLQTIGFAAEFYKSLLGAGDLDSLLTRAGRAIEQELPGTGVTFFLRQPDGCEIHAVETDHSPPLEPPKPEHFLNSELIDGICKSDAPCTLDELCCMGLDGDLGALTGYSIATFPLSHLGRSLGFMLAYRQSSQILTPGELRRISFVTCGLAQAIHSVRVPLTSRE